MRSLNKIIKFLSGFLILLILYYLSMFLLKFLNIVFPATILALILFTLFLYMGIIKKEWVKTTVNFFLSNMPILFVPFIVGLISYKQIIIKNWLIIFLVVSITTTLIIVMIGFFVEYGIKIVRFLKLKGRNND